MDSTAAIIICGLLIGITIDIIYYKFAMENEGHLVCTVCRKEYNGNSFILGYLIMKFHRCEDNLI